MDDPQGHVLNPSFGYEIARELRPVRQLMGAMRTADKKSLTSYEQQLLLREMYEQEFGIYNHNLNPVDRPLSLVELHDKEVTMPYSREARLMHRFASLRLGEIFNISFPDFLNQSRARVEYMIKLGEIKERVEDKNQQELRRTMDQVGLPSIDNR